MWIWHFFFFMVIVAKEGEGERGGEEEAYSLGWRIYSLKEMVIYKYMYFFWYIYVHIFEQITCLTFLSWLLSFPLSFLFFFFFILPSRSTLVNQIGRILNLAKLWSTNTLSRIKSVCIHSIIFMDAGTRDSLCRQFWRYDDTFLFSWLMIITTVYIFVCSHWTL